MKGDALSVIVCKVSLSCGEHWGTIESGTMVGRGAIMRGADLENCLPRSFEDGAMRKKFVNGSD